MHRTQIKIKGIKTAHCKTKLYTTKRAEDTKTPCHCNPFVAERRLKKPERCQPAASVVLLASSKRQRGSYAKATLQTRFQVLIRRVRLESGTFGGAKVGHQKDTRVYGAALAYMLSDDDNTKRRRCRLCAARL